MSTFLFDQIVFGPVKSRRLGESLGINLLPTGCKYCNFDCIYCECGWNTDHPIKGMHLPKRKEIAEALEQKLKALSENGHLPDAITFAGNGEPTIHPDFPGIIDDTINLRNRYAPKSVISVLSNATMLHKPQVVKALQKVDQPILKLDSAIAQTIEILNQPVKKIPVSKLIAQLKSFNGKCIIQTMFVQGDYLGHKIDNTTPKELDAWMQAIMEINPMQVMIYTIDRDTPAKTLQKVPEATLKSIAHMLEKQHIDVQISA